MDIVLMGIIIGIEKRRELDKLGDIYTYWNYHWNWKNQGKFMDIGIIIGIWGEVMDVDMLWTWSKFSVI